MTFAIMMCVDAETERRMRRAKRRLQSELNASKKPIEDYAFHITLGVFQGAPREILRRRTSTLAGSAGRLTIEFAGIGFFAVSGVCTAFLPVIPSRALLDIHKIAHRLTAGDCRRDNYYDPDKWLPHCTIATGIKKSHRLAEITKRVPKSLLFGRATIKRVELVHSENIDSDAADILESFEVRAVT